MNEELIQAIDYALAGEWDKAHKAVQEIKNKKAYWIHAVLHKIEGDEDNSRYWYARAKRWNISAWTRRRNWHLYARN